jgi:hypothetical protein
VFLIAHVFVAPNCTLFDRKATWVFAMIESCLPIRVPARPRDHLDAAPAPGGRARMYSSGVIGRQWPPSLHWEKLVARAAAGELTEQAQPQAPGPSASGPEHDRARLRPRHSRQVRRGMVESPALDHLGHVHPPSPLIAARPRNYPVNSAASRFAHASRVQKEPPARWATAALQVLAVGLDLANIARPFCVMLLY